MPIEWDETVPKIEWDEPSIKWDVDAEQKEVKKKALLSQIEPPKNPESLSRVTKDIGLAAFGTAKELSKVSYLKYFYPSERDELKKLSNITIEEGWQKGSNLGTRKLLFDALEATMVPLFTGKGKAVREGAKQVFKSKMPRTYKLLFETPIGGKSAKEGTETVAQKILDYKNKNGKHPTKEMIDRWWKEASTKVEGQFKTKVRGEIKKPVVGGHEAKEPLPKYAQSVNLEKQNISAQAKKLEIDMAEPKKVQTWEETGKLSDSILADKDKYAKAIKKTKSLEGMTENVEAVRKANAQEITKLASMAEDVNKGILSESEFDIALNNIKENYFKLTSESASELGRALNAHKKVIGETDSLVKGLSKLEKGLNSKQRNEFIEVVKSGDPHKIARFTAELEDPKLKDYILEYWYNSILSGPPTHAVNIISNTMWSQYQIGHRVHKTLWDSIYSTVTGKQRERYFREILPSLMGYGKGWKRGMKEVAETFRTGKLQEFETKWSQEMGLSSVGAWERSPSKFMRKVAPVLSVPTRALRAMDVWANAIAYDSEIMALATRNGIRNGLKGDKLKTFIREFAKNPTKKAHEQAMKFAKHNTFMDDPDKFTSWVLQLRQVPVAGPTSQFVVPFVNTIGNLTKRGLELTPGIGIAKEMVSRKMGRGMSDPELIAKQIEGSILSLYMLYKADMGEITGAAPESEAERERFYAQGKQPHSIRLGDSWVSYRRIEPFNTVLSSTANVYNNIINAKDDDTRTEIFANMVGDFKNNLIDSSYFQGLQQVFNRHQKIEKAPQRTVATFIPYSSFWRAMNRAYEKATEGDVKVREKDTWLSAFAQVIPHLAGKVPTELNIWGEEKVIPGSILQHWLPYKWSKETQDPVEIELARLNNSLKESMIDLQVYPGQPGDTIKIGNDSVKLDKLIYRDYLIDLGRKLRTAYEDTMHSQSYLSGSDEKKATMLLKKTRRIRGRMRKKLKRKIK